MSVLNIYESKVLKYVSVFQTEVLCFLSLTGRNSCSMLAAVLFQLGIHKYKQCWTRMKLEGWDFVSQSMYFTSNNASPRLGKEMSLNVIHTSSFSVILPLSGFFQRAGVVLLLKTLQDCH